MSTEVENIGIGSPHQQWEEQLRVIQRLIGQHNISTRVWRQLLEPETVDLGLCQPLSLFLLLLA